MELLTILWCEGCITVLGFEPKILTVSQVNSYWNYSSIKSHEFEKCAICNSKSLERHPNPNAFCLKSPFSNGKISLFSDCNSVYNEFPQFNFKKRIFLHLYVLLHSVMIFVKTVFKIFMMCWRKKIDEMKQKQPKKLK